MQKMTFLLEAKWRLIHIGNMLKKMEQEMQVELGNCVATASRFPFSLLQSLGNCQTAFTAGPGGRKLFIRNKGCVILELRVLKLCKAVYTNIAYLLCLLKVMSLLCWLRFCSCFEYPRLLCVQ